MGQDLDFPPSLYFHWVKYRDWEGCPWNCSINYDEIMQDVARYARGMTRVLVHMTTVCVASRHVMFV